MLRKAVGLIKHNPKYVASTNRLAFSTSKLITQSKVQSLAKNNNFDEAVLEFERKPTPFDATFLINQKEVPFETCQKIFNCVKQKNKINPLVAIINASSRCGKHDSTLLYLKELSMMLDELDDTEQKLINEGLWNMYDCTKE